MNSRRGWSERLLEWLLPAELAEEIAGDLTEEWQSGDRPRPGPIRRLAIVFAILGRLGPRAGSHGPPGRRIRLALRRMRREPGLSAVFVTVLALGIGVNMAMLSVADAVLLAPLPYPDSDRLGVLSNDHRGSNTGGFGVSYESVRDIRRGVPSVESVGLYLDWQDVTYDDGDGARRMAVAFVSREYVELLGLEPSLGRLFDVDENAENAPGAVAILGQGAWRTQFGQDRSVVGRTLSLNGRPVQVTGVMSDDRGDLRYLWQQDPVQLYLPLFAAEDLIGFELDADRGSRVLSAIVRVRDGVPFEAAEVELAGLSQRLANEFPRTNEGWSFHLEGLHEEMFSELRAPVAAITGISVLVLLLVGVNLATLALLGTTRRLKGVAVRRMLGESRAGIAAQSLIEGALVATIAFGLALVGAKWGLTLFTATAAVRLPTFSSITLHGGVIGVGVAIALMMALVLGLLPAGVLLRKGGPAALRSATRGSVRLGSGRAGAGLVSTQVAVAVVLLTGAGLLLKSYTVLRQTDYGFDTERLLLAQLDLRSEGLGPQGLVDLSRRIAEDTRTLPSVEEVFTWGPNRLGHGNRVAIMAPEGRWATNPEQRLEASRHSVEPGTLARLGIEVVSGRDFAPEDGSDVPRVAIVSESMARALWPDMDPVGRRVELEEQGRPATAEVVGVARDARHRTRLVDPFGSQRDVYYPFLQVPSGLIAVALRYASGADVDALADGVRNIVREQRSSVPVYGVTTMAQQIQAEEGPARVAAGIMLGYAGLAAALAALGLFGVLSHSVRLRVREIGIRKALGAERGRIVWWVVGRGLLLTSFGIVSGAAVAVPVGWAIRSALYGVTPFAPSVLLTVWGGLILVAVASCWLPARLAAAVPPAQVLGSE